MLKCWQHDANKRPKFSDICSMLPEYKPEQVKAAQESIEIVQGPQKCKKDWLPYKTGDVITVLDRRPLPDASNVWKGVLCNGKTGLFNPANTVAYVSTFPTSRPSFSRADAKCGLYASKRRLRTDMISRPQGDFKHTGHVGLDGAFFGDISFLGDKYHQLPRQIVTPYKPQDDKENVSPTLTTLSSDSSDKIPLLKKFSASDGRSGSSSDNWSEMMNDQPDMPSLSHCKSSSKRCSRDEDSVMNLPDHEYHEISEDEEDFGNFIESTKFESLDLGPSLMDEVFKALGSPTPDQLTFEEQLTNESNLIRSEPPVVNSNNKLSRDNSHKKKQQAIVKPISAADQHTIDSAIAIAKELATKSLLDLEHRSNSETNGNDVIQESPKTPSSPFKRKFSFKFSSKSSPKADRRNFSEEAEAIPDITAIITDEAKEAYDSLVQKGSGLLLERSASVPPTAPKPVAEARPRVQATSDSESEESAVDSNPLRMLRSGVPVRPKVRGNKHGIPNSTRAVTPQTSTVARMATLVNGSHHRTNLGSPPPVPQTFPRVGVTSRYSKDPTEESDSSSTAESCEANPLPLPPRDRSKPILPVLKHHQRKHPLVLPGSESSSTATVERRASEGGASSSVSLESTSNSSSLTNCTSLSVNSNLTGTAVPPPKPARTFTLDDSFDKEIQAELDSLDNLPQQMYTADFMYKGGDHVSCEDLLEFALDKPNARRTQGRSRGIDSDEVRIIQKVMEKEKVVSPEDCLNTLNEVDWDIHNAVKYMRLKSILSTHMVPVEHNPALKQTLIKCNWDLRQSANYLLATHNVNEDTTEV